MDLDYQVWAKTEPPRLIATFLYRDDAQAFLEYYNERYPDSVKLEMFRV